MTGREDIASRLAAACVDERGRLVEHALVDCSIRAALAADLARAGRLTEQDDAVVIDTAPVGWPPVDAAAGELQAGGTTLDGWIHGGVVGLGDVVAALVDAGAWTRRTRRFPRRDRYDTGSTKDRWGRTPERRLVQPFAGIPAGQTDATVLLLACAAGIGHHQQSVDVLLERTAEIRWLCEPAWRLISAERARNLDAVRAMRLGRTIGAPG